MAAARRRLDRASLVQSLSAGGTIIFMLLQLTLFGVPAITMLAVQLVAQPLLAAGVINGFGHAVGYRGFEMPASATNIVHGDCS